MFTRFKDEFKASEMQGHHYIACKVSINISENIKSLVAKKTVIQWNDNKYLHMVKILCQ